MWEGRGSQVQGVRPERLGNCIALLEEGHMGNPNMVSGVLRVRCQSDFHGLVHAFFPISSLLRACTLTAAFPPGPCRRMRTSFSQE